jgi:uncharacterized protein YgbK (DUF1537 family)
MTDGPAGACAVGLTLADAWAWAEASGATRLGFGTGGQVIAPAGRSHTAASLLAALPRGQPRYALACGNQRSPPDLDRLAESLAAMMHVASVGFAALCLAAPAWGRTVYQGHLFDGQRHLAGLVEHLRTDLFGRIAVVGPEIVAAGAGAVAQRLNALRAADVSLALVDAIDEAGYASVSSAFADQIMVAGPAWLAAPATAAAPAPPAPAGPIAVLSGACDRQTLFQLGIARGTERFLQLALQQSLSPAAEAVAWAGGPAAWAGGPAGACIIATSAAPDRLAPGIDAAAILGQVAQGLAAAGWRRFIVAGNDSAVAVLTALNITALARGDSWRGLRWWHGGGYSFLLKPGGFGGRDLLSDLMEPQIGLNSAAE